MGRGGRAGEESVVAKREGKGAGRGLREGAAGRGLVVVESLAPGVVPEFLDVTELVATGLFEAA